MSNEEKTKIINTIYSKLVEVKSELIELDDCLDKKTKEDMEHLYDMEHHMDALFHHLSNMENQ